MRQWWNERTLREKLILGIGALLLVAFMYYGLLLQPLHAGIERMQARTVAEMELGGWLVSVSPEVQNLRRSQGGTVAKQGGSLLSIVDQTSKAAGLGTHMTRIQPEGEAEVRAWLDAAPFNETLRWLRTLENSYGVTIAELSLNRDNEAGRVKARVILKRPN